MMKISVDLILRQLSRLDDQEIRRELAAYNLAIDDTKYHVAFSSYGLANKINQLPTSILQPDGASIPDSAIRRIQHNSTTLFCAYTAFVYMRSNHLEKGLDAVKDDSVLAAHKTIFRRVLKKQNHTLAQHIRNSLCHGTFNISPNEIVFCDYEWKLRIIVGDFIKLCEQIYRLYKLAFEASSLLTRQVDANRHTYVLYFIP